MKALIAVGRLLTLSLLATFAGAAAAQQAYPSKPIRLISSFPPGGSNSILSRLFGQKLAESWGQQVIVDNRPGANGIIGTEIAAKAPRDGYTIILVSSTHVINSVLAASLPFDSIKDFTPVATLTISQFLLAVNPLVPANNLQEVIALARSKPGQLNYASSGNGAVSHLAAEQFSMMAGIKMQHIPYKGAGPALIDLVGGQVQLYFATTISTMPHIKSGKVRAVAIAGERRVSVLPQLPTFSEAGLPGFEARNWFGILAPAGIPKAILDKLAMELARILATSDTREKLASQGLDPFISTPEQFAALMKTETQKFAEIIKAANIKAD